VGWEAEACPVYGDFAMLPFLIAIFPVIRFLLDRLIFEVILMIPAAQSLLESENPV
jgi:hypothetical protein